MTDRTPRFEELPWDGEQLGISCGLIDCTGCEEDEETACSRIEGLVSAHPDIDFITVKVPCACSLPVTRLIRASAVLIDTEVIYRFSGRVPGTGHTGIRFVPDWNPEDFIPLAAEMTTSRLFLDTRIPYGRAHRLWSESIRNHCTGRADALAVAFSGESPAGMVTLQGIQDRLIDLHMVGVLKGFRNQGHGKALLSAVTAAYGKDHDISVTTSCRNRAAQRLYQAAGFSVENIRHTLHIIRKDMNPC